VRDRVNLLFKVVIEHEQDCLVVVQDVVGVGEYRLDISPQDKTLVGVLVEMCADKDCPGGGRISEGLIVGCARCCHSWRGSGREGEGVIE
jgi:hypothetical protein